MRSKTIIRSILSLTLMLSATLVCDASNFTCDQAFSMVKKQVHPVVINRAIFNLHRHLADFGKMPDVSKFEKVAGVNSRIFFGIEEYSWSIWRYHDSQIDALTQMLQKLDQNTGLNAAEKANIKKLIHERLTSVALLSEVDNEVSISLLLRFIAIYGRVPKSSEFSNLLGYSQHKFLGLGAWHPGNDVLKAGSSAHLRLNDSREDAYTKALNRVKSNDDLSEDEQKLVSSVLEQQILFGPRGAPPPDPNLRIQEIKDTIDRLHRFIAEFGRLPDPANRYAGEAEKLGAGFNENKFFGRGIYAQGKESALLAHNRSTLEGLNQLLDAVDGSSHLGFDEKQLVASFLQFKIQGEPSGDFSTQSTEKPLWILKQNELANRRLHRFIADHHALPDIKGHILSPRRFSNVLQMSELRYFGLKLFAADGKSAGHRLNDSPFEAFKKCLQQVEDNTSLSEAEKVIVRIVLERRIAALTP